MTHPDPERDPSAVANRPLCRRYALVIPAVTRVRVSVAQDMREHAAFWMLGWLADGECEPLGLCVGAHALPGMLDDFKSRGLERVWHVAPLEGDAYAQEAGEAVLAIERSFPGARASSRPHMLPGALAVAREVRDGLTRAVRRHGHFERESAALEFLGLALLRAERRLDRERRMAKERHRLDAGAATAMQAG